MRMMTLDSEESDFASIEVVKQNLEVLEKERKQDEKLEKEEIENKKLGRPPGAKDRFNYYKVDPRLCEKMLTAFDNGESRAQVCANLGIARRQLDRYMKDPSFKDAFEIGFERGVALWDKEGKKMALGENKDGNATIYTFTRKNLHGFRDKTAEESKDEMENESLKKLKAVSDALFEANKKDV